MTSRDLVYRQGRFTVTHHTTKRLSISGIFWPWPCSSAVDHTFPSQGQPSHPASAVARWESPGHGIQERVSHQGCTLDFMNLTVPARPLLPGSVGRHEPLAPTGRIQLDGSSPPPWIFLYFFGEVVRHLAFFFSFWFSH